MYKVLIADDEHTIRKGLSEYMPWATVNCEVSGVAKDGFEAMELIKNDPPDIVVTELKMPRQSGIDVARFVHENHPKIKVIILTGFAEFEYARSALVYGASDYLLKPVSKEKLLACARELTAKIATERGGESDGSAISPYVGKLYDIEKHIYAHEYEQGRQRALSLVSELGAFINRESRHSPLVGKALAYIRENCGSAGLSLNNLSENLHANPSHLSRTFKKETGETVTEYINRTRIEKAKELLTFTSLLSYEVSEAVGFNDYTYFSSVFKKITGVSPKDFKNG